MIETWNSRLEVTWAAEDKKVLDSAVLLAQSFSQPSYVEDVLRFLYQQSGADVIMICQKTGVLGEMSIKKILLQGQLLSLEASYPLEGTPCGNVSRHGVLYFPSGVKDLFPKDTYLKEFGIESYFGAPLLDASDELLGVVALLHQEQLPNPKLLEFVLTILSPSLEALLEAPV